MPFKKPLTPIKDTPFIKCARKNCINRGIYGLKVCVPAAGHRMFEHAPMTAMIALAVCDEHYRDVRSEEFITEPLRNEMEALAKRLEKVPPDFKRAYMDAVPVNEPEWLEFMAKTKGN